MAERGLSERETDVLIAECRRGSGEALDELTRRNLALVRSVALRFRGRGAEYDDLVQTGSVGLVKAIVNFDPAFGTRFSTYAVPMISGEIKRSLRDGGVIKVSRRYKELALSIKRLTMEAERRGEEPPRASELAKELGVKPAEIAIALEAAAPCISLCEPVSGEDGAKTIADTLKDPSAMEQTACDRALLSELMRPLCPRERSLIRLRFFLDLTQKETAKRLGLSQVQVSRLEKRILAEMRERAGGEEANG
ncbi:MAG: sigma-70 family RNA polymerase sigma factor [Clostridiales bacterium]|nr:sigma-70 family RNA polymerase sigma factor [Clostridiales bacterium]